MRSIFSFLFLFAGIFLSAQNLVVNPDFEDCGTPWIQKEITVPFYKLNVPGWTDPSGTSDYYYFKTSKGKKASAIDYPQRDSGQAYGGFIASENGGQEYIEGTLNKSLEKGKTYRFSVSIYDTSISNLIPRLGIYFSYRQKQEVVIWGAPIPLTPQIKLDSEKIMDGRYGWHTYYQDYTATGDEQYFIIGAFDEKYNSDNSRFGYVYIDNVSLVPLNPATAQQTDSLITEIATETQPEDSLIAPGKTFVTQNILFETNKAELKPEAYPTLNQILAALKAQPNMNVEIDGHTDNVGNADANQKLSEARAKAVADFFIANGIAADRIVSKGFGSSKPIGDDNIKNRRVEFIFSE